MSNPVQQHLTDELARGLGITAGSAEVPMVFLDIETCGLGWHDPVWEVAAIRRVWGEPDREFQTFVEHDPAAADALPDKFRVDHDTRYDPARAVSAEGLGEWLAEVAAPLGKVRPVLLGAVPMFDATRLHEQFGLDPWHYRPVCVETMAWTALHLATPAGPGPLAAPGGHDPLSLPWASDPLTRTLGVPSVTNADGRYTALVDARWARDTFDAVMARRPAASLAGLDRAGAA